MPYLSPSQVLSITLVLGAGACSVYDTSLLEDGPSNPGSGGQSTAASTASGGSGGASTSSASNGGQGGAPGSTSSMNSGGSGGASTSSTSSGGSGGASTSSTSSGGSGGASTSTSTTSSGGSGGATGSSSSVCTQPSDCPGVDDDCKTRSCTSGVCGMDYANEGATVSQQILGDCMKVECDGQGNVKSVIDDTDSPDPGTACKTASCDQGAPKFVFTASGTACSENGGKVCDGSGACVGCTVQADCGSALCVAGQCVPGLVISEIRTRGVAGGEDEFIELYNPSGEAVTLDSGWQVRSRSDTGSTYGTPKWSGTGQILPAHGHFLIVGTAYSDELTAPHDGVLAKGLTDAASLLLEYGSLPVVVDAACFFTIPSTRTKLMDPANQYICEGEPASNFAHKDSTTASNVDASLERKPGGALGSGTDTGDSLADFSNVAPSSPQGLASAPTPP